MTEPCYCESFSCAGNLVSSSTLRRHVLQDRSIAEGNRASHQEGIIGDFDKHFDSSLYEKHWTAKEKISESSHTSVLEMLFQISRDFVMSEDASKEWVSSQLSLIKKNFLSSSNDLPETFDQMIDVLDPFLLPMHTFDVCKNDCVLFHKEHETAEVCPICGEGRYKVNIIFVFDYFRCLCVGFGSRFHLIL